MMLPLCPVWNGKAGDAGLDAGAHLSLACASHLCCPAERAVPKSVIRSAPCSKSWASLEGQRVAAGPVELPQPSHLHDLHAPLAFEAGAWDRRLILARAPGIATRNRFEATRGSWHRY